ncbi:endo alpha-1,4 polygalactosaminidase [Streptomyces sp. LN499]|uniref:endo alpha-1,4 polygalactosaminidase n=1 Tax=Streptomyces sp. LN499 TaxID=3112977 RepID=UPI00371A7C4D
MSGPGPALTAALILSAVLSGCTPAPESGPAERWGPRPGADWQWQLSGRLDPTVDVPVYDIDGFEHDASAVADLHRRGRKVICYVSTGAWEDFRPELRDNRLVARIAHRHGLAVGLKNDLDQISQLEPDFDFAVNEQCAQYDECAALTPFIEADKAVFHVEYEVPVARFCPQSKKLRLSSLRKKYELGVWRRSCTSGPSGN